MHKRARARERDREGETEEEREGEREDAAEGEREGLQVRLQDAARNQRQSESARFQRSDLQLGGFRPPLIPSPGEESYVV